MKKLMCAGLSLLVAFMFLSSCSTKAKQPKGYHKAKTSAVMATVESINLGDRTVTLKEDSGKIETITVSDDVKNLEKLDVGDRVITVYQEAVAMRFAKEGDLELADVVVEKTGENASKPAGSKVKVVKVVATVIGMNLNAQTVTLKGPLGKVKDVYVDDLEKLRKVKLGDKIHVTYTEAVAVSVVEEDAK